MNEGRMFEINEMITAQMTAIEKLIGADSGVGRLLLLLTEKAISKRRLVVTGDCNEDRYRFRRILLL